VSDDEAVLVERVVAGDKHAFAALAQRHLSAIESYALRTLGDAARAQDVAQEVMLRLWQQAARFDPARAKLTTWLHQIAYNLCMDQFRHGARWAELNDAHHEAAAEADTTLESQRLLNLGLARLPERQRTALVLTYYQSLPNRDVAEIMGLSVRALESLLARARKALREGLEEMS